MTINTANHVRPRPGARTPQRVPTRRSAELHPDQRGQQPRPARVTSTVFGSNRLVRDVRVEMGKFATARRLRSKMLYLPIPRRRNRQ